MWNWVTNTMLSILLSSDSIGLQKQISSLNSYHKHYVLISALIFNKGVQEGYGQNFNILRQEISGYSLGELKEIYSTLSGMYQNSRKQHNQVMAQLENLAQQHTNIVASAVAHSLPEGVSFEEMNLHTQLFNLSMKLVVCTLGAYIKPSVSYNIFEIYRCIDLNFDEFSAAHQAISRAIPIGIMELSEEEGFILAKQIIEINKDKWRQN
jgi:hypothetical protein